jgi:hypothetical protein
MFCRNLSWRNKKSIFRIFGKCMTISDSQEQPQILLDLRALVNNGIHNSRMHIYYERILFGKTYIYTTQQHYLIPISAFYSSMSLFMAIQLRRKF